MFRRFISDLTTVAVGSELQCFTVEIHERKHVHVSVRGRNTRARAVTIIAQPWQNVSYVTDSIGSPIACTLTLLHVLPTYVACH